MKRIIYIILLLISINLNAQTKLDSMLFNKINEYRVSNGVNIIEWDTNIFKAANHHSTYLKLLNYDSVKTTFTHTENVNVDDFDELLEFFDRFDKYTDKRNVFTAENVGGAIRKKTFPVEKIVDIIFNGWKNSIEHNKTMLNKGIKYGACSTVVFTKCFYILANITADIPIKSVELQKSFSTLNVSK